MPLPGLCYADQWDGKTRCFSQLLEGMESPCRVLVTMAITVPCIGECTAGDEMCKLHTSPENLRFQLTASYNP